jgi:signal transduction histidine kinase/CheY-like chemotaxis protein
VTPTLSLVIGTAIFCAVYQGAVALRSEDRYRHLATMAFSIVAACYTLCSLVLYSAESVEAARFWSRLQGAAGALLPAAGALIAHTSVRRWRPGVLGGILTALVIVAGYSLVEPAGIFYGGVTGLTTVGTGTAFEMTLVEGTPHPLRAIVYAILLLPMPLIFRDLLAAWHAGERRVASLVGLGVLIPLAPALVDMLILGVETLPFPWTELGLGLATAFFATVFSDELARSASARQSFLDGRARHRWMVEAAPEALLVVRPPAFEVEVANRRSAEVLGRPPDSIRGARLTELLDAAGADPESLEGARAGLAEARDGRGIRLAIRLNRGGASVPFDIDLTPFSASGKPHVRVSLHDASERIAFEARHASALEQLRKGEAARRLARLTEGMARGFADALTPVLLRAELAWMEFAGSELASDVAQVHGSAQRAAELVRQLQAIGGGEEAAKERIRVGPVVGQALRFLRTSTPVGIDIDARLEAADASVVGTPLEVHRVVMNLGVNAVQAMGREGRLTVRLEDAETSWRLSIADTGDGIPPEFVERIFDPFFTTKGVGEGTGLGLATVREIVEGWGGEISVTSLPGEGATFVLDVPRVSIDPEEAGVIERVQTGASRILVLSGHDAQRTALAALFRRVGHRVDAWSSLGAALGAASNLEWDAAVVDLQLRADPGPGCAERLRTGFPDLPLLLHSGLGAPSVEELEQLRPVAWLGRPLDAVRLTLEVDRLLRARR